MKKKKSYMKTLLTIMFIFLFLFTCVCLFITYKTGTEPSTLIMSVFALCSIEGGLMSLIKTTKIKNEKETINQPNESEE